MRYSHHRQKLLSIFAKFPLPRLGVLRLKEEAPILKQIFYNQKSIVARFGADFRRLIRLNKE